MLEVVTTIREIDLAAQGAGPKNVEIPREATDGQGILSGSEAGGRAAFLFALFVVDFSGERLVALAVHNDRALIDLCIVPRGGVHVVVVNVEWELHGVPQFRHMELVWILGAVLRLQTVSKVPEFD